MSYSKFMRGSPLLEGGATTPGAQLTKQEKIIFNQVLDECKKFGLDFYSTIIQKVRYDEMSEIAAYGGFFHRYPHWYWGMQYEELQRGYEHNQHKIYELVINTEPCIIYILSSNPLVDNVCVVAHATGHNDFFKNNIFFKPTDTNMMNRFASNGDRIRKYMSRWGKEKVTQFIDHVLRIDTLIDPTDAWFEREVKDLVLKDTREYSHPRRLKTSEHMDHWINTPEYIEAERARIKEEELAQELGLFRNAEKNIFKFLIENAKLKTWQVDIMHMLYEEALYFSPQRSTKTLNEGWASYVDFVLLARQGLASLGQASHDMGIVDYAIHKAGTLGGKYSVNPYKTGFTLLLDIEERWNKGQFGPDWENCKDRKKKEEWDQKLGLGKEKVFEVRKYYNDVTLINEFLTQDFCDKHEYFEWKHYPNGEWKIETRDAKRIKKKMLQRYVNGGLPDIRIVDPNHRNKDWLLIEHFGDEYDDRELEPSYARAVMTSLYFLWGREVVLATKNSNKENAVYFCAGMDPEKDVMYLSQEEYEKIW